jgi:hypothetical protein
VSSKQNPAPSAPEDHSRRDDTGQDGPRPVRLTLAAALAGLEGLALVVAGAYLLVTAATGGQGNPEQGVTTGATLLVLAALPLLAARGLRRRRRWSRGPAVITQILALPVAWNLLQADSLLIPGGIVLALVAVTALVLLVNPSTTKALGIRPPGDAA